MTSMLLVTDFSQRRYK